MSARALQALGWAFAAAVIDQTTKALALEMLSDPPTSVDLMPFLSLRLGFNTGISFGIGGSTLAEWPGALATFKLAVVLGLLIWACRSESGLERIGLSLMAGGAIGNALDRWWQGAVTDFIDLHWAGRHWPTFNSADIAITIGVALILFAALIERRRADRPASITARRSCRS